MVTTQGESIMNGQRDRGMRTYIAGLVAAVLLVGTARAADLELVKTIALKGKAGSLDHLALDAKRDHLFLANKTNNTLDVIDLKAEKLLKQIPNQQGIQGIAYAADLDKVYVGLGVKGFCNIFNGEDFKLLKSIKFQDDADNVRYNAAKKLVYVAHAETALGVIDAETFALRADIKLPGTAEGFEFEKDRPRLYVAIPKPGLVQVIDTEKNEPLTKYPITLAGGAHPLAIDEPNHRIFVGCRAKPLVVIMDSETGKEITSVPIPGDVDDLVFDAKRKRLYATCGEGFIAVIKQVDADHYEAGEKIATVKGAKTSLFAPDRDKLYLAVPRQEGKDGPEVHVYQVKP
jgi:DNA-binding beta-propeller fold protein YncE